MGWETSAVIQILEGAPGLKGPAQGCPTRHRAVAFGVPSALGAENRAWLGPSDQPNRTDVFLMGNKRPCALRAETWLCINI